MVRPTRRLFGDADRVAAESAVCFLEGEEDSITASTASLALGGPQGRSSREFDRIGSDYVLSGMTGIEFREVFGEQYPDPPFIYTLERVVKTRMKEYRQGSRITFSRNLTANSTICPPTGLEIMSATVRWGPT